MKFVYVALMLSFTANVSLSMNQRLLNPSSEKIDSVNYIEISGEKDNIEKVTEYSSPYIADSNQKNICLKSSIVVGAGILLGGGAASILFKNPFIELASAFVGGVVGNLLSYYTRLPTTKKGSIVNSSKVRSKNVRFTPLIVSTVNLKHTYPEKRQKDIFSLKNIKESTNNISITLGRKDYPLVEDIVEELSPSTEEQSTTTSFVELEHKNYPIENSIELSIPLERKDYPLVEDIVEELSPSTEEQSTTTSFVELEYKNYPIENSIELSIPLERKDYPLVEDIVEEIDLRIEIPKPKYSPKTFSQQITESFSSEEQVSLLTLLKDDNFVSFVKSCTITQKNGEAINFNLVNNQFIINMGNVETPEQYPNFKAPYDRNTSTELISNNLLLSSNMQERTITALSDTIQFYGHMEDRILSDCRGKLTIKTNPCININGNFSDKFLLMNKGTKTQIQISKYFMILEGFSNFKINLLDNPYLLGINSYSIELKSPRDKNTSIVKANTKLEDNIKAITLINKKSNYGILFKHKDYSYNIIYIGQFTEVNKDVYQLHGRGLMVEQTDEDNATYYDGVFIDGLIYGPATTSKDQVQYYWENQLINDKRVYEKLLLEAANDSEKSKALKELKLLEQAPSKDGTSSLTNGEK